MEAPERATGKRLGQLFADFVPEPPKGVFEIGLVLGGTVSAGAYTAGALDFLLEALEAWHESGPPHRVVLKAGGGSSGGAVCAAILGLLSERRVPHVRGDFATLVANTAATGNPLWDLWVNEFRMERLLATDDIEANLNADEGTGAVLAHVQHVASLLDCRMIDAAAQQLVQMGQTASRPREYFAAPFRVAVTVANLRGIPYKILDIPKLGEFSGAAYVQHDDFAWFAFPNGADPQSELPAGKREDEFWLGAGNAAAGYAGYGVLAAYATASGAMPVGLAARALVRPLEHYLYRPIVRPCQQAPGYVIDWPDPDWVGLPDTADGTYRFTAVDGGTFNNDPVSLVHRALCGLVGHNPRSKHDATRTIFMIDPLADQPKPIAPVGKSLMAVVQNIVGTAINAARYLTADMALFAREDVFSRFQLVPFRPEQGRVGEAALAGTSLYAAAGWCAREFRVHDFLLGRWNMQEYLRKEFVLAGDNPLYSDWSDAQRAEWAMDDAGDRIPAGSGISAADYWLPVIPVMAAVEPNPPPWPRGALDPATLKAPISKRLHAVLDKLRADNLAGPLPWLVGLLAIPGMVDFLVTSVIDALEAELRAAKLRP